MFPLSQLLKRFVKNGTLDVIDAKGKTHRYGSGAPIVTMRLTEKRLYRKLFFNPELCLGEAYVDGTLSFEGEAGLTDFMGLFGSNRKQLARHPVQRVMRRSWKAFRRLQQHNPIRRARKNVAHHYDLDRELFQLFLDEEMEYSCAYFETPDATLEEAQLAKKRHIAAKLCLKPGQRVLDIGCGWGGMAFYLAEHEDVKVHGVTLSEEQHALATQRAAERGLSDRVTFALMDYRDIEEGGAQGPFDRIVSVGMFEHVGVGHYQEFFAKLGRLLHEDGLALLHSIGKRSPPSAGSPWLRKYIFPGGYTPALSEVLPAVQDNLLWPTDIELLRLHYAETLKHWYQRFMANREKVAALLDERFCRMWEFYLIVCEHAFRTGAHMVFQMQLAHKRDAAPLTRDYIAAAEARYRLQDAPADEAQPPSATREGRAQ